MSDFESSSSLENQFLIAMPQLRDFFFANSVTLVWKHNSEGALGIVINKPMDSVCVADIFKELDIVPTVDSSQFRSKRVLSGGPVERDKGFIIHDATRTWESSISLGPRLSICTSRQILQDIADGKGPRRYQVALGCAGWDAGQLEREIGENAWLTSPADQELVFSDDWNNKAAAAAALLGIDLRHLPSAAGHS